MTRPTYEHYPDQFTERAFKRARELGLKQDKDIAKLLGISAASLGNWKKRGVPPAKYDHVATTLDRSVDDLLHPDRARQSRAGYQALSRPPDHIPIVGHAQAGFDVSWDEMGYPVGHSDLAVRGTTNDNGSYGLIVRGDSNWPRMREGDAVVTSPNLSPEAGQEVVIRFQNGDVAVKVLAQIVGDTVHLDSYNAPRVTRKLSEIEFMHVITGIHPPGALIQRLNST